MLSSRTLAGRTHDSRGRERVIVLSSLCNTTGRVVIVRASWPFHGPGERDLEDEAGREEQDRCNPKT